MKLILTLEPYAKQVDPDKVLKDLELLGLKAVLDSLSREGEIVINIENLDNIYEVAKYVRNIEYICHIIELKSVIKINNTNNIIDLIVEEFDKILRTVPEKGRFKILCKRVDKKFPLTSVELCKIVGRRLEELGHVVDIHLPDMYLYVEIRRGIILLGWSPREVYHKVREVVPLHVVKNVVPIVLEPITLYEYMDLLQLARALGIELRIINFRGNASKMVEDACRKLRIDFPVNVKIVNLDNYDEGIDALIVLSQYSSRGDSYLREICKQLLLRNRRIGLVLGNEVEDVPVELREKAICEIRLGPMTGQPMRSTVAIAYAMGIIFNMFTIREIV
ncbi:MAG: hypothetical protein GXO26_00675 [Crenarchaeota archaeon]|nr:hypothetical protein [Thermoproteota archaeon]